MLSSSEFIKGYTKMIICAYLFNNRNYLYNIVKQIINDGKGYIKLSNPSALIIMKELEKELKQYGIFDKKIIKELSDSTFDEYLFNLEKQNNENDAFLNALDSMRTTIKANYNINKFNKFRYSLLVSSIALTTTLIIAIIGWLNTNILYIFNIIYPLLAFITLIYFIYTVITYKKRNYLDFIIVAILFTSVIAITIQCFLYLYKGYHLLGNC